VLPLHHEATSEKIKARIAHRKSAAVAFGMRYLGRDLRLEQNLCAFSSRFDFQGLPALCH
jgi:hypothetical protein